MLYSFDIKYRSHLFVRSFIQFTFRIKIIGHDRLVQTIKLIQRTSRATAWYIHWHRMLFLRFSIQYLNVVRILVRFIQFEVYTRCIWWIVHLEIKATPQVIQKLFFSRL